MRRLFAFALMALLTVSVALSTVVHAGEAVNAAFSDCGAEATQQDGAIDKHGDSGAMHAHGSCHGHHVGVQSLSGTSVVFAPVQAPILRRADGWLPSGGVDPALRPPQA